MINVHLEQDIAEWVSVETVFPTPQFSNLLAWWGTDCGAAELPGIAAISPASLRPYLGNLLLIQPIYPEDGTLARFLVRIHGTNLAQRAGYHLDGRYLDDIPNPEFRALAVATFQSVLEARRPLYTLRYRLIGNDLFKYASLFLPFSDGGPIGRILVYLAYLDELGNSYG